ncbi:MAG: DUF2779 domain-containing protein [Bacteroidota bacterium]|nr:DUF2779 domain-containing protein [Bacteroidota bacterium]
MFPGGIDASDGEPFEVERSVLKTQELIRNGQKVIYEAAFKYDGVLCYMDILVKDDGWKAYEVKGSTNLKNYHIDDASLQYYVITHSGLQLEDISIACLNNKYVRQGKIEPEQLFKIESVLEKVKKKQREVEANIAVFRKMLKSPEIPAIDIGPYCSDPYDCDFKGHCWKHIPENTVFDISRLSGKKKFAFYNSGILSFEDLVKAKASLNPQQWMQIEASMNGTITQDKKALKSFCDQLSYPLYFMDFETFQPAVPLYDNSRPYQQIPFQYSMHLQKQPGGEIEHAEFLSDGEGDPREAFIESLIFDAGDQGAILVYNQTFEVRILNELARDFPVYKDPIEKIKPRIVDLMRPFRQKHYYSPDMHGSYSIKKVLPALVPELKYDDLEISEGGAASRGFEELKALEEGAEKEELRQNLLEYCKMDTWAMVKILEKIK